MKNSIPSFEVIGNPNINVVAFRSNKYNLSTIIDSFEKKKWNLNILQNPLCLHICITPANIDNLGEFINILKNINDSNIVENDGLVAIYGLAAKISNKKLVNEIIYEYLDTTTDN